METLVKCLRWIILKMKHRIAIIPARGGSKRLPRKNILPFNGHPLISWSIRAAIDSKLFDAVYVSSEDTEIKNISSDYGAIVLSRPVQLSQDTSTVAEVCCHHLSELLSAGQNIDQLFCLYPTAPLRDHIDLLEMASIFDMYNDVQSVIAVTKYSHYPYQALSCNNDGKIMAFWPDLVRKRSNELPKLVAGNGSTYAANVGSFLHFKDFYMPQGMYAHEMSFMRSIDVDEYQDLEILKSFSKLALER